MEGVKANTEASHPANYAEKPDNYLFDASEARDWDTDKYIRVQDVEYDHLIQMILETDFQNEFLKCCARGVDGTFSDALDTLKCTRDNEKECESENTKELQETVDHLRSELRHQREIQNAADDALKHLQEAYCEADAKVQSLSSELVKAKQKMNLEIKERDEKYVELETKFGRLLKRAKQRIQELQKEKDDLEAQCHEANEEAEKASLQQVSLQQEIERIRHNANEALLSMDVERQQLRATNNKLQENINEISHALETKVKALEGLQLSLSEKEQLLESLQNAHGTENEKREALIVELSAKHQRHIESLEAQLADALVDRSKADGTITSLQALIAEKESKIAVLEVASSGKIVRLQSALDVANQEANHMKEEHEKERAEWDASFHALKSKLEMFESTCLRSETEAAKLRSQLEMDITVQKSRISQKDAELSAAKKEIARLVEEYSSYKTRAHALLQKKDAEVLAAKDTQLIHSQDEEIKLARRELQLVSVERDNALQDFRDVLAKHKEKLAERDAALSDAEKHVKEAEAKLESYISRCLLEKDEWQLKLEKVEQSWQSKFHKLEVQIDEQIGQALQMQAEELRLRHEKLQEEYCCFRNVADKMIEEKDKEILRLLNSNNNLRESLKVQPPAEPRGNQNHIIEEVLAVPDIQVSTFGAAEQQILLLARQQAQREEELAQSQRHILALQDEVLELERENRLHSQLAAMLKEELRDVERSKKREGIDMTYLKNVILKLLETGEVEALLPVLGMLLQFSPEEMKKCQQVYKSSSENLSSAATASADDATTGIQSLLSRLAFI